MKQPKKENEITKKECLKESISFGTPFIILMKPDTHTPIYSFVFF